MKGNDGTGNNIERDEWKTPQWLFDKLNEQYNFSFDCCACDDNFKCEWYSSDFLDEKEEVFFSSWMNPPFSKALAMFRHFFKIIRHGVCIYRCDNFETKIWQEVIFPNASWIFIPNKRIAYDGMKGSGSRFPSALIGFNVDPPKNIDGVLLQVK
jgi:hypothetical protein